MISDRTRKGNTDGITDLEHSTSAFFTACAAVSGAIVNTADADSITPAQIIFFIAIPKSSIYVFETEKRHILLKNTHVWGNYYLKKHGHKGERTGILQKLREEDNTLFLDTVIEIHNSSCVYITGCDRIKDYNAGCIKLSCRGGAVVISGEHLRVEGLVNSQISISGKLVGVEFCDD